MLILVCKYFVIALIFKRFTECHFSFDCGKENIIQKLSFWNWGQNYADGYIFLFHNIFFSLSCCGNSADCSHCRPTTVDPEIILSGLTSYSSLHCHLVETGKLFQMFTFYFTHFI